MMLLCIHFNLFSYYQDIIINNRITNKGERSCEPTYKAIKKFLTKYKRDFTVLDLGAAQGFFSFKIGYEFPHATCVMIEGDYDYTNHTDNLLKLCVENNTLHNIIFLKSLITPDLLQTIAECEHFDLVLALNFIHHCGHNWKTIIEKICSLGDYVIIENPPTQEGSKEEQIKRQGIENFILDKNGILLAEVPRHTTSLYTSKVFLLKTKKSQLIKRNILWPPPFDNVADNKVYTIKSDFLQKKLIKSCNDDSITATWHKGINLLTFKMINGVFPYINEISALLTDQLDTLIIHNDLTPANIILQGKQIQVIDQNDFHYLDCSYTDTLLHENQKKLHAIDTFLYLHDSQEIYKYYWKHFSNISESE